MSAPIGYAGHGILVMLLLAAGCNGNSSHAETADGGGAAHGSTGGHATGGNAAHGGAGGDATSGTGGDATGGTTGGTGGDAAGGTDWLTPPPVDGSLVPPEGATVKLHAHAVGAQIYTCTAGTGADDDAGAPSYAWVLKAPDAKLYDAAGTQVGTHGAGPSWTWRDGSKAVGMKLTGVNAPAADAIQWLLLRVTSTSGSGKLDDVTYVQRLNTVGGTAPMSGCDATTQGTDTNSSYSADYYFYIGGAAQ